MSAISTREIVLGPLPLPLRPEHEAAIAAMIAESKAQHFGLVVLTVLPHDDDPGHTTVTAAVPDRVPTNRGA